MNIEEEKEVKITNTLYKLLLLFHSDCGCKADISANN